MPKTTVKIITLTHPMTERGYEMAADMQEMYAQQGYMLHGTRSEGSIERVELHKTLDYNREERRAAKRSGQELKHNSFKGILPDGYQPIMPDDPRLQMPAPEGATP